MDPDLDAAVQDLLDSRRELDDVDFIERIELVLERFERHIQRRGRSGPAN